MTEQELLELKAEIDEARSAVSELTGRKSYLEEQLKDVWHCSSSEEAKGKIEEFDSEIKELTNQFNKLTKKIQDDYNI